MANNFVIFNTSVPCDPVDVPVLIVGGGPSGLLQAHLLSSLGVRSLIVERYPERLGAPQAHALSPRSLEICRQFGLDVNDIRKLGSPREDAYWVNCVTSVGGETVGRLPYERMDTNVLNETPTMIHNIPQPRFEELLAERLEADRTVEIRKNVSFIKCKQFTDGVITTVKYRRTQRNYQIRSRHMIACDGARSSVREYLDIESEREDSDEAMMTIHFSADLRPVVGDRVGILHWIMDPTVAGFVIGYDLSDNQALICSFNPKTNPIESWNTEHCRDVVRHATGRDIPFEVLSFRPWVFRRMVANKYRVGNVFLAGDAAHSFPPTGGLGLADVHNLAYKIAAVHQGWARHSVLDTYESERRPVALINSQQSVKNGEKIFTLLKSLGTTSADPNQARANLYKTIHDAESMKVVNVNIEEQREQFDNLGLHIGYVYGNKKIPSHASLYTASLKNGARLPHVWITYPTLQANYPATLPEIDNSYVSEFSSQEIAARRFSSLDLCDPDAFTIIVGCLDAWQERLARVIARLDRYPLRINAAVLSKNFDIADLGHGASEAFKRLLGLADGGGLVVRPDQHILMSIGVDTSAMEISSRIADHLDL